MSRSVDREENVIPEFMWMALLGLYICMTVLSTFQVMWCWVEWLMWFLLSLKFYLELQTQWSDVGLEMRVTLIVSTTLRNRKEPLKFCTVRTWIHFLQVFEQENSAS